MYAIKPRESECHLNNNYAKQCNIIVAINNYTLFVQLNNNKILAVCKKPLKIVEECRGRLFHYTVSKNVLISSKDNCKIMINNVTYENTYSNFTYEVSKVYKSNFKFANKYINLDQKHFGDLSIIKTEAKDVHKNIELHPSITHIAVTLLLILLCSASIIIYVFICKILKFTKGREKKQIEEVFIQLEEKLSSTPQAKDALS